LRKSNMWGVIGWLCVGAFLAYATHSLYQIKRSLKAMATREELDNFLQQLRAEIGSTADRVIAKLDGLKPQEPDFGSEIESIRADITALKNIAQDAPATAGSAAPPASGVSAAEVTSQSSSSQTDRVGKADQGSVTDPSAAGREAAAGGTGDAGTGTTGASAASATGQASTETSPSSAGGGPADGSESVS
jgi:cobalamin biosynthesis Mg chelatase CobN